MDGRVAEDFAEEEAGEGQGDEKNGISPPVRPGDRLLTGSMNAMSITAVAAVAAPRAAAKRWARWGDLPAGDKAGFAHLPSRGRKRPPKAGGASPTGGRCGWLRPRGRWPGARVPVSWRGKLNRAGGGVHGHRAEGHHQPGARQGRPARWPSLGRGEAVAFAGHRHLGSLATPRGRKFPALGSPRPRRGCVWHPAEVGGMTKRPWLSPSRWKKLAW